MPPFVLDLYDRDPLSSDDFIGRCIIPMSEAKYSLADEILEPQWHKVRVKPESAPAGEVLVSFTIVESDFSFKIPVKQLRLQSTVETKEFQVDINVLGLRDL